MAFGLRKVCMFLKSAAVIAVVVAAVVAEATAAGGAAVVTAVRLPPETVTNGYCSVTAGGKALDVFALPHPIKYFDYQRESDLNPYGAVFFEADGETEVAGTFADGKRFSFRARPPFTRVVENGGRHGALVVCANLPERDVPDRNDPKVKWFGPGRHRPGEIRLASGETLYLEAGAVVEAPVLADGKDISVRGRGILSGLPWEWRKGPAQYCWTFHGERISIRDVTFAGAWYWALMLERTKDVTVEGVRILGGKALNDDGIDVCRSENVTIRHAFIRSQDDCIAPKWWCRNLLVENCTLWTDYANIVRLGWECDPKGGPFENLVFRDLTVCHLAMEKRPASHEWFNSAFCLQASNGQTIRDVTFDRVAFTDVEPGDIQFVAYTGPCGPFAGGGRIDRVQLGNFTVPDGAAPMITRYAANAPGEIGMVTLENVAGRKAPELVNDDGPTEGVLVEAEAFSDVGGWSVDQQFMDQIGSSFLLAHGLGKPVASARTKVVLPAPGAYRLWARTRDWVAPHGAGAFEVLVDGTSAGTFGKGGSGEWEWWRGGEVKVEGRDIEVEVRDLTGFEGRVDALFFARGSEGLPPPNEADYSWRRQLLGLPEVAPLAGEFDFCVVGGGFAGMCAAVAAARKGLTVALVQDRPVFGGNGSVECRVVPQGKWGEGPFPNNRRIMEEFRSLIPKHQGPASADNYRPDSAAWERLLRQEKTLTLFLSQRATDVKKRDGKIESVRLRDIRTGVERIVKAKLFADCTGDATVAERAGAETMWQPCYQEKYGLGSTLWWAASNRAENVSFPELPWACKVENEQDALVSYECRFDVVDGGTWNWETGFYRDPVKEGEAIRDKMLRGIWGWWAFAKNRSPKKANYAKMEIYQMGYVLGKRDAHRIVGDYVLTEEDLVQHRVYPDGVVDTTWYIDLHTPHGEFRTAGCEKPVEIRSYPIPYRCFCSRDVGNLFMAGKDISGTYRALASFRVMNTTAQMGSMVGKAAALCVKNGWSPRELGAKHFDALAQSLKR